MMRRSKREYSPSAVELAGQRAWSEAWGYHRDNARRWFYAGIAGLGVGVVGAGSACWLAGQTKVVPYLVSKDGPTLQTAVLEASMPDASRISGHLRTWIEALRTVSLDNAAQLRMVNEAYAWTDSASTASAQLNAWYSANNPQIRATTATVDVEVQSVIPAGGNAWQVDWKETAWPRDIGRQQSVTFWRALIVVSVKVPTTDAEIRANWDGVWTESFHFQQIGNAQ